MKGKGVVKVKEKTPPRLRGGSHKYNSTTYLNSVKVPLTGGVSYVRARFIVATKIGGGGLFVVSMTGGVSCVE
jgi:hypothetical protein